jgi:hypothetical protein
VLLYDTKYWSFWSLLSLHNISSSCYSSEPASLFDLRRLVLMQVVLAVCFVSVTCMKVSFVWRTVYWYWITREIAVWVHLWFIMIFPPDLSFPIRVLLWSLLMCFQICMYLTFISSCMLWPGICLFSLANALVGQTGCTSEPKQSFSSSVLWLRKCIDAGPHTVRWMLEGTLEMHVSRSIGQCSKIC